MANGGLCLTYFIPQGAPKIIPGTLCFLPLRKGMQSKIVVGVLLEYCEKPNFKCVPIQGIATFEIIFSEEQQQKNFQIRNLLQYIYCGKMVDLPCFRFRLSASASSRKRCQSKDKPK